MKTVLLFIIFILHFSYLSAQISKKDKNPANLDSLVYELRSEALAPRHIQLPFSKIEILDARFDTSKLGFEYDRTLATIYKNFKRIKLLGGVEKGLVNFYNDYYQNCFKNSSDKLLIVIKKLWIDNLPNRLITENRSDIVRSSFQDIHVKFEYYLHRNNEYFPLSRIDTVFQLTEDIIATEVEKFKKNNLSFFTYTVKACVESLNYDQLLSTIPAKRSLTIAQIDSFNQKRFSLPILTAATYNIGVFMTVQEFINNAPTFKNFKINKKKVMVTDDESYKSRFYWAYYDGKGLFIRPSKAVDLHRIGNTFEFFVHDDIYISKTVAGNLLDLFVVTNTRSGASYRLVFSPRQIDMETGIIY